MRTILNMIRCRGCGQVLISLHQHDFRSCPCGTFTDGGPAYTRRGGPDLSLIEDYTVVLDDDGALRFAHDIEA